MSRIKGVLKASQGTFIKYYRTIINMEDRLAGRSYIGMAPSIVSQASQERFFVHFRSKNEVYKEKMIGFSVFF